MGACLHLAALGAALGLTACAREPDGRVNVLLISLDSVRADQLGAYGARQAGRSPTPTLDRLAAEGELWLEARATSPWTLPSHAALMTGEPELVHAVEQDGQALPASLPTLAERLADLGYRTCGVYSGPYLEPVYGFARGFQRYEAGYGAALSAAADELALARTQMEAPRNTRDPERARVALDRLATAERALEVASHRDQSSARVTDLCLAELERAADDSRPFFLFAHYFDPHYDYAPPEPWASAFDPDYHGALDGHDYFTGGDVAAFDPASPTGRRRVASDRDLEHVRALYAGEIAWTDSELGRLLAGLARLGLAERTLVVVVGDHGEEFFEHGSIGHRQTLYEESLRVPVILRLPGRIAAGTRRDAPITLCDVLPRLCELSVLPPLGAVREPPVSRLVRIEPARETLSFADGVREVPVQRVHVLEAFHQGSLKLVRQHVRRFPSASLGDPERAALERLGDGAGSDETLSWIDLQRHPAERREDWSGDFSDPRARAALEAFRASYAAEVARRAEPTRSQVAPELEAALRALGYPGPSTETPEAPELVWPVSDDWPPVQPAGR